jgi:hypothetical protein
MFLWLGVRIGDEDDSISRTFEIGFFYSSGLIVTLLCSFLSSFYNTNISFRYEALKPSLGKFKTRRSMCKAVMYFLPYSSAVCDNQTSWITTFLENLITAQLVKEFLPFYETRRFIQCSQEAATRFNPEQSESSPHSHILQL